MAQPIASGPFVRSWTVDGTTNFPNLARAFGTGADLDQDGRDDIVLGNEVAYCTHGAIVAFRGLDGEILWQAIGSPANASCMYQFPPGCEATYLGHKRICLVDLDGDQAMDVLASGHLKCHARWLIAPNAYGGLHGSVFGFRGSDGAPLFEISAPSIPWSSLQGTGGYGWSFDGGHDVTGDGDPDIVASAYIFGLPGEPILRGALFATEQTGTAPFAVLPGVIMGDQPGGTPSADGAIEFLDDVDGDGVTDFLVSSSAFYLGAPYPSPSFVPSVGIVRLLSGATFQILQSAQGAGANEGFGYYMGTFSDVNGDGIRDFFASIRAHTTYSSVFGPLTEQRVEIRSGADLSLLRTIYFVEGADSLQAAHERVIGPSPCDDVDGDGGPEIVLPTCGTQSCVIRVVSMATGLQVHRWSLPSGIGDYWTAVGAGDLNGDGLGDVLLMDINENGGGPTAPYGHGEAWLARNFTLSNRAFPGGQSGFEVRAPRWASHPYRLLFSLGTDPPAVVGPFVIPLALDPLFWASAAAWFGGTLDASGRASYPFAVPNAPGLAGTTLYASGLVLDPSNPFGIGTVLTVEEVVIG